MKLFKRTQSKEISEINKTKEAIKKEKQRLKKEQKKLKKLKYQRFINSKIIKIFFASEESNTSIKKQILNMLYYELLGAILCLMILYILSGGKNYFKIYHDLYKLIDTYDIITSNYYGKIDKQKLVDTATSSMVASIDDSYTSYSNKKETEDFEETVEGTYEGIGTTVTKDKEGKIIVYQVFEDTPAYKAGLKEKDIILKLDDMDFSKKPTGDIANYIKSSKNSKIKLTIIRDNQEKDLTIKRAKIKVPTVASKIIEKDNQKIGYINISIFSTVTGSQFKKELQKLEKKKINALIIDVRNNNGGYLKTATEVPSLFLKKGQVIYQLSGKYKKTKINDNTKEYRTYPVAVLVNRYSASASEILAAAMKESYNSYVVGTRTYGKGTVQKVKNLKDGTMIKFTVQKWLTPKGNWINKKGLTPTHSVELKDQKNDNQLEKAIELLIGDLTK